MTTDMFIDSDDFADTEMEEHTALSVDEQVQAEGDYFDLLDLIAANEAAATEEEES